MIETLANQPLMASLIFSFSINFIFFLVALLFRTDKVTDLSYSLSFALLAPLLLIASGPGFSTVQFLVSAAIVIWALRLGIYLFWRILVTKTDERFDDKRNRPMNLVKFWILQIMAVWIIMLPFSYSLTSRGGVVSIQFSLIGFTLFSIGFVVEAVSDFQKFVFKRKGENRNKWMNRGFWKYSRHPNYFGEIVVWWGLFVVVVPLLGSKAFFAVLGPLFITILLLFVSGIPLLEKSAEKKYGNNPQYVQYRDQTSLLIPWPPRRGKK